jgi:hypothetical protein
VSDDSHDISGEGWALSGQDHSADICIAVLLE